MLVKLPPRLPLILGGVLLAMTCATTTLLFVNRGIQSSVNQRQVFINQTTQLGQVNQALIRSVAAASVKQPAMRKLLADYGLKVTYTNTPKSATPAAPPEPQ